MREPAEEAACASLESFCVQNGAGFSALSQGRTSPLVFATCTRDQASSLPTSPSATPLLLCYEGPGRSSIDAPHQASFPAPHLPSPLANTQRSTLTHSWPGLAGTRWRERGVRQGVS